MSDDVVFQTSVTATPPNATRVATDSISGRHYQLMKLAYGDDGTAYLLAPGTPMPIGTLSGGTVVMAGTGQMLGTIAILGTLGGGTVGVVGTLQTLGTYQPLAGSVHVANTLTGTFQPHGTTQALGTYQQHGTAENVGTFQPLAGSVHLASRLPGTVDVGTIAGTLSVGTVGRVVGTVSVGTIAGTIAVGTIAGTVSALGTFQPLAGSVHIANSIPVSIGTIAGGTIQAFGTTEVLGTVRALTEVTTNVTIGTIAEGTIQSFTGTAQILGTVRALTLVEQGTIPGGTVSIVGTLQTLGTYQPLDGSVHIANAVSGTVQVHGTVPVGTVAGTVSALGTVQPLAGSVHLATNLAGGTVVAVGSAAHDAAADTRPLLIGAFGSSGTQAAVNDGDAVRLWADLSGRLQVRGTIDSLPVISGTVQTHGTSEVEGTVNVGGTVNIGTIQSVRGTIDVGTVRGTVSIGTIAGTVSVLGSVQPVGTAHIGTVQRLAGGTLDVLTGTVSIGTVARVVGTVDIGTIAGTVRPGTIPGGTVIAQAGGFGSYFSTAFTAAVALGTVIANPGQGTRWRIFDITVSASASGTLLAQESASAANGTVVWGPLFFAGSGGWQFNSARGLLARGTNQGLYISASAGTMAFSVNYALES